MLRTEMPRTGRWLFKYRSYLPVAALPAVVAATRLSAGRLSGHPWLDRYYSFICAGVAFLGVIIRADVVGHAPPATSGRNTREQVAESLTTTGLYSLTRNPLYLGNLVIALGVAAVSRSWEFVTVILLAFLLYYERIIAAEEEFLEGRFGDEYRLWAESTPWLLPRLRGWRPHASPFSLRKAIRGEFYALNGLTSAGFAIEHARIFFEEGRLRLDEVWGALLASSALIFVVCRTLKKRTRLLS